MYIYNPVIFGKNFIFSILTVVLALCVKSFCFYFISCQILMNEAPF